MSIFPIRQRPAKGVSPTKKFNSKLNIIIYIFELLSSCDEWTISKHSALSQWLANLQLKYNASAKQLVDCLLLWKCSTVKSVDESEFWWVRERMNVCCFVWWWWRGKLVEWMSLDICDMRDWYFLYIFFSALLLLLLCAHLSSKWILIFLQEFVNFAWFVTLLQLVGCNASESKPPNWMKNVTAASRTRKWISISRHFLCFFPNLSLFRHDFDGVSDC